MGKVCSLERARLIKEAHKLLDRIETNLRIVVEHSKNKKAKKSA